MITKKRPHKHNHAFIELLQFYLYPYDCNTDPHSLYPTRTYRGELGLATTRYQWKVAEICYICSYSFLSLSLTLLTFQSSKTNAGSWTTLCILTSSSRLLLLKCLGYPHLFSPWYGPILPGQRSHSTASFHKRNWDLGLQETLCRTERFCPEQVSSCICTMSVPCDFVNTPVANINFVFWLFWLTAPNLAPLWMFL